jgi:hypothetical protein
VTGLDGGRFGFHGESMEAQPVALHRLHCASPGDSIAEV